jgi:hypothetical protein
MRNFSCCRVPFRHDAKDQFSIQTLSRKSSTEMFLIVRSARVSLQRESCDFFRDEMLLDNGRIEKSDLLKCVD